jgi:hypothetical protein
MFSKSSKRINKQDLKDDKSERPKKLQLNMAG